MGTVPGTGDGGSGGRTGFFPFGDRAYPVLVGVTVEIVPRGMRPIGVGHHLHVVFPVTWLFGSPGAQLV